MAQKGVDFKNKLVINIIIERCAINHAQQQQQIKTLHDI